MVEHIKGELMPFRVNDNVFLRIQLQSTRKGAGKIGFILQFVCEYVFDSITVTIALILRDGQTNVDVQTAVCGGGVVGLRDRLPLNSVLFKYLLNFVIVSDVPEPTVKFCEQNHVKAARADTIKKADKFLPASEFLPSSQGLVDESVNQHHAIHFDELIEESVLRFQSVTVKDLTVMGTTYIFNNTQAEEFRLRSEVCTIHKNLLSAVKKRKKIKLCSSTTSW